MIKPKIIRWTWHATSMGNRNAYRGLVVVVVEDEGMRPLGRHTGTWEDYTAMDLDKIG